MKKIKLIPSGKEVACGDGETVLSALEKNGYMLPNNCRAGACGECKIKVLGGTFDQGFVLDMALSQEERAQGYGLMCMAKVTGPLLEIEFANENARPKLFPPQERLPFVVVEKRQVTASIIKLSIRSLGKPMRFWPGQYVTLGNAQGERSYSVANNPNSQGDLVLFVSKVKDGKISNWIHDSLAEGDVVMVSGPYGSFIGNPQSEGPVLCLAAGSGLAPIMSLATAALMRGGFSQPATIVFSAKSSKDIYEQGHFAFMQRRYRNFRFIPTLTGEKKEGFWHGRIPDILAQKFPDLSATSVYIAGSVEFVEATKAAALSLGLKNENLYVEGFHSNPLSKV